MAQPMRKVRRVARRLQRLPRRLIHLAHFDVRFRGPERGSLRGVDVIPDLKMVGGDVGGEEGDGLRRLLDWDPASLNG